MTTFSGLSEPGELWPFDAWRDRCARSDSSFNEVNISATEAILRNFALSLEGARGSREMLLEAVKDVVMTLNSIGGIEGALGNFIETQEREELCDLINPAARAAGLDEDAAADITEEWREW